MKTFYTVVFVACLILLVVVCMPATPSRLGFIHRLALHRDQWDLKLSDPDQKVFAESNESGKAKLLAFIERYRHTYWADKGWLTSALAVAAIFSLLGRAREARFIRQATEAAPPNGGAASRLSNSGATGAPPSVI